MKKKLIIAGAVVAGVIVLLLIIPFLIPMERYKSEIAAQVKEATGRDLTIAGKLSLSLFPNLALTAEKVSLSNVETSAEADMANLDKLHISLKLRPLLSGKFVVDGFSLVRPVIHLEIDQAGRGNWEFASAKTVEKDEKKSDAPGMLGDLTLGDVRLTDGEITYLNTKTGKTTEAKAINATLSLPKYDGPVQLNGSLVWNREKIDLDITTANLKKLMDGQNVAVNAKMKSAPVTFSLVGNVTKGKILNVDGDVVVDAPSVRKLAAWAGKPLTTPGTGLGPLAIAGHLKKTGNSYVFSKANIRLDNIRAKGTFSLVTGGERLKAGGNLDAESLDLNPYLPPVEKRPREWSTKTIDMSSLKTADLSFDLRTQSLKYRKISVGPSTLDLDINNGNLTADLKKMSLYGGTGTGRVSIESNRAVPEIKANFALAGVAAEPLLRDAGGYERLTGTLKTNLDITTHGKSQHDMMSALNGKGDFRFSDGSLKGVDLAAIAETIEKITNGVQAGGASMLQSITSGNLLGSLKSVATIFGGSKDVDKTTKFTSLNASWQSKNGLVTNDDLQLIGPLVQQRALFKMTGKGQIMLPPQEINYEAEIRSFAKSDTANGIGGKVRLTGPVENPNTCVLLGGICIGKGTKPGDLLKLNLKGLIPGFGKSDTSGDTSGTGTETPAPPSPVDQLRNIFKGIKP